MKLLEHVPDMLRYRAASSQADVIHFQWLAVQWLDWMLLPRSAGAGADMRSSARHAPVRSGRSRAPLVLTAHDVMPREPLPGQLAAQRMLYRHFDAIVVHSQRGRRRLTGELGVAKDRVVVIPHGIFQHLRGSAAQPGAGDGERPPSRRGPVVLQFGLLRPYKGIDVLLRAWRTLSAQERMGGELWIAGMSRMDLGPLGLHPAARWPDEGPPPPGLPPVPEGIRIAPRFIGDEELGSWFEAADLVVLPYLQADQSGVLFTALAFGKPLLLSDVGGFPEIAATSAAISVPAGNVQALATQLRLLLSDPDRREQMAGAARKLANPDGALSWSTIAKAHLDLYEQLRS